MKCDDIPPTATTQANAGLLKPDQAAAWLGVSASTFHRIVQSGAIPSHKIGKRARYRIDDLAEYVEAGRRYSIQPPPPAPAASKSQSPRYAPSSLIKPGEKIHNPYLAKMLAGEVTSSPSPLAQQINRPGRKSLNPFSEKYAEK